MEAVCPLAAMDDALLTDQSATSVQSLDEEIQNIEMEEADDKAMGREPTAEEVPDNAEVSLPPSLSQHF